MYNVLTVALQCIDISGASGALQPKYYYSVFAMSQNMVQIIITIMILRFGLVFSLDMG